MKTLMRNRRAVITGIIAVLVSALFFLVPFAFIALMATKDSTDSAKLDFSLPHHFALFDNLKQVIQARNYMMVVAFINSTILTVVSVTALVIFGAMAAFVLQRRGGRLRIVINLLVLAGLIVPPAVVPTIWVLQKLGLYKSIPGLIFIEIAYGFAFTILLFQAFISTVPRELDEAATIDGAGPIRLFFSVVFPVLRSVIVTVIILQSVAIFNDFANPLYFAPGDSNATLQLTLFNFQSQFTTQYNLLFTDILLVTVPPLIMFLVFNRKIIAGMAAGAVKG
jgi:raffinose/stachyose/melibiose transport system permease protein